MANLRLVKQYISIFDTQLVNDFHDILVDGFYFRSPKIQIFGKRNYIEYVKQSSQVYTTDTLSLVEISDGHFVHNFYVTMFDSVIKLRDRVDVVENIRIESGLIVSSIIDYKINTFSKTAKKLLADTVKNHGTAIIN